jgi:dihydrofolate synthase/folylpolyglutamate synthase
VEAAFWPGRMQVLRKRPLVICDGAHNAGGARMLVRSLEAMGILPAFTIFAVLRDKRYGAMLRHLTRISRGFIFTKPDNHRALPVSKLKAAAREIGAGGKGIARVGKAVEYALDRLGKGDMLLVCGSLFAVGEAMHRMGFKPHRVRLC